MVTLGERFEQAMCLAAELHREQRRKVNGAPYISHLLAVAAVVLDFGGDEDEAIAALLHDAIEDQGGQAAAELIRDRFGQRVLDIVEGCTDAWTTPKPPWKERKDAYIARLAESSPSVRLVSGADKICNIRSLIADYRRNGDEVWSEFKTGPEGILWYFQAVADTIESAGGPPLLEELRAEVDRLRAMISRS